MNCSKVWQPELHFQSIVVMLFLLLVCMNPLVVCSTIVTVNSITREPQLLQIVAIIPTEYNSESDNVTELTPDWKKGEEILPGALLAAKEINEASDLLNCYRLEVIPIRIPQCELSEGIVPFVEELTSNNNIIGIVGYFCHNVAQHLSQLVHYGLADAIQISANDDSASNLQHSILPLRESMASATAHLLDSLGWKKIAVISNQHPNFIDSRLAFLKSAEEHNIQIAFFQETFQFHSPIDHLRELQMFGIKIIVAFVPPSEAADILCTAYLNGFKWPDYAWIFTDISKPTVLKPYCQSEAINNAIFLQAKFDVPEVLLSRLYYDAFMEQLEKSSLKLDVSLRTNPYTSVLYDSIWAVALTVNRSLSVLNERNLSFTNIHHGAGIEIKDVLEEQLSRLSFQGTTGWLNFSHSAAAVQTSVEVYQIQDGQPVLIGLYSHSLCQLFSNRSAIGTIPSPSITFSRMYIVYPIALTVIMLFLIVFCIVLTTVSMCLFVYHRNKPPIKATSNTLSLCMFIGCYFLLASSLIHTITSGTITYRRSESFRTFLCMLSVSGTTVGIDTVLATVIAKTLRIYHIFKTFGTVSRVFSDLGLFILILSIVCVKIPMLIVWASLDAARLVDVEQFVPTTVPPFIQVIQQCQTRHQQSFWLIPLYSYSIILGLVMVLLAVMTRKIKRKDYKDSKKINILVVALILDGSIASPLWIVLRLTSATILSRLAYNIGTMLAALLCQVLLILPKTLPLVVRNCPCLDVNCTFLPRDQ